MEKNKSLNTLDFREVDEINLLNTLKFLLRNKFLISSVSLIFLFSSAFYSFTKKYIWEGRIQIVLDNNDPNQIPSGLKSNIKIPGFSSLKVDNRGSLETEVAILESPFVLMPVFDYVYNEKIKLKINKNNFSFQDWKDKNLEVSLKEGTSVLNISYRDENKSLIKPVLNKISKIYQDYSGKSKKRNFQLAKNYLTNQILFFKKKGFESIRNAQDYAISQDLRIIDLKNNRDLNSNKNESDQNPLVSNIGIENIRVNAANRIRNIDIQINKIKELNDDPKQIQYIGSTISGLVKEGLPQVLEEIETDLIDLRSKYTDKDESILRLIKKRDLYINLLKERSIGYLKAEKMITESLMQSAMRPKGVLLKYKELMREANRDENMLVELENQLKVIQLEEARLEDPWTLITKPTLLDYPVAPRKKNIVIFGTIIGLFIGLFIAFIKEKRSGLIFDETELELSLKTKIIEKLNLGYSYNDESKKNLFIKQLQLSNNNKNIKYIFSKNIKVSKINLIKEIIEINSDDLIPKNNFKDISDNITILITNLDSITYEEVEEINKKLSIYNKNLYGIILFKSNT